MSQQKQAPLPRQEFQEWLENAAVPVLVLQKGKHLGSVVKVPATPEIDYLFWMRNILWREDQLERPFGVLRPVRPAAPGAPSSG